MYKVRLQRREKGDYEYDVDVVPLLHDFDQHMTYRNEWNEDFIFRCFRVFIIISFNMIYLIKLMWN